MSKIILDQFGMLLMKRVRDMSINELDQCLTNQPKDVLEKRAHEIFGDNELVKRMVSLFIPIVVDTVIHYFLWMLEDEKGLRLSFETSSGVTQNIREFSDGLSGEIATSEGWVVRFSKERYDEVQLCTKN